MVEYAVVIRRQLREGGYRWQLWQGSGLVFENVGFLEVMNRAGADGFEAVAAGHFDELAVPEILLQRRIAAAPEPIETTVVPPTTKPPRTKAPKIVAKSPSPSPAKPTRKKGS